MMAKRSFSKHVFRYIFHPFIFIRFGHCMSHATYSLPISSGNFSSTTPAFIGPANFSEFIKTGAIPPPGIPKTTRVKLSGPLFFLNITLCIGQSKRIDTGHRTERMPNKVYWSICFLSFLRAARTPIISTQHFA